RNAFDHPQRRREYFTFVVERSELDRPEALDVPSMKELVAGQLEPAQMRLAYARRPTADHQHRRPCVLETATRFRQEVHEDVALIGKRAPELLMRAHNRLEVLHHTRAVEERRIAGVREHVEHAINGELVQLGIPNEDWRINQGVVVGCAVRMRRRRVRRWPDGWLECRDRTGPSGR